MRMITINGGDRGMSEVIKKITSTYNDMSESKKYNQSYLEGYRQCVVDAQESEPQLNEDQKTVFSGLKFICANYQKQFGNLMAYRHTLRDLYFYLGAVDIGTLENKTIESTTESYQRLSDTEISEVIQAFTDWWLSENN